MEVCVSSPFDLLPNELSLWAFTFLGASDIARAARVCRLWHQLSTTQPLWKHLYIREKRKVPSKGLLKHVGNDWKRAYRCAANLDRNWREAKYGQYLLKGHEGRIWAIQLDFIAGQLISASADGELRQWDLHGQQTVKTFKGHRDEVFCLQFDHTGPGGRMVSGSYDSTIKIWDVDTGAELSTLRGHSRWVRGVKWHQNRIVSASGDTTVKLWDAETGVAMATMTGHRETVVCVHYDGAADDRTVVSGSADGDAFLWDVRCPATAAGQPARIFRGHSKTIVSLQLDAARNLLATASSDASVKLWDFAAAKCTDTLGGAGADGGDAESRSDAGHSGIVTAVQFDDGRLVSGSCDGTVKIWKWGENGRTAELLYSLNQESPVYALAFDAVLASGDDAHNIRIWDFSANIHREDAANGKANGEVEEGEGEQELREGEGEHGGDRMDVVSPPDVNPKPPKRRRECIVS